MAAVASTSNSSHSLQHLPNNEFSFCLLKPGVIDRILHYLPVIYHASFALSSAHIYKHIFLTDSQNCSRLKTIRYLFHKMFGPLSEPQVAKKSLTYFFLKTIDLFNVQAELLLKEVVEKSAAVNVQVILEWQVKKYPEKVRLIVDICLQQNDYARYKQQSSSNPIGDFLDFFGVWKKPKPKPHWSALLAKKVKLLPLLQLAAEKDPGHYNEYYSLAQNHFPAKDLGRFPEIYAEAYPEEAFKTLQSVTSVYHSQNASNIALLVLSREPEKSEPLYYFFSKNFYRHTSYQDCIAKEGPEILIEWILQKPEKEQKILDLIRFNQIFRAWNARAKCDFSREVFIGLATRKPELSRRLFKYLMDDSFFPDAAPKSPEGGAKTWAVHFLLVNWFSSTTDYQSVFAFLTRHKNHFYRLGTDYFSDTINRMIEIWFKRDPPYNFHIIYDYITQNKETFSFRDHRESYCEWKYAIDYLYTHLMGEYKIDKCLHHALRSNPHFKYITSVVDRERLRLSVIGGKSAAIIKKYAKRHPKKAEVVFSKYLSKREYFPTDYDLFDASEFVIKEWVNAEPESGFKILKYVFEKFLFPKLKQRQEVIDYIGKSCLELFPHYATVFLDTLFQEELSALNESCFDETTGYCLGVIIFHLGQEEFEKTLKKHRIFEKLPKERTDAILAQASKFVQYDVSSS